MYPWFHECLAFSSKKDIVKMSSILLNSPCSSITKCKELLTFYNIGGYGIALNSIVNSLQIS